MKIFTPLAARHGGRRGALRRQSGVTLVEFALVTPFALLLVLGIIQLGLMYTAKEVVNEGAFLAARAGAVQHAQVDKMKDVMVKSLVPFYQDTTNTDDLSRLAQALVSATTDTVCIPVVRCFLEVEVLNPTPEAFDDFGITSNASEGHTYIPNDNLEYRPHSRGGSSNYSIQDANALKIKVTYGYELKVPLMKTVFGAIMCGVDSGVSAFGRKKVDSVDHTEDCIQFYRQGRVPIVSYATVQMQTPAWKAD